ncbi:DUF4190 domain-containing protein [Leifsonia poae]|uniref:DUF4190 domain-containing protein n=1 Tax=Leifsonia poae TaxID=110933 RepID=UPI003D66AF03
MTNFAGPQTASTAYAAPTGPIAQPARTLSITSLVLGLASIVFSWTFVAPIAGLVVGILALKQEPAGRTMAIWGIVLNAVMLAGAAFIAFATIVGAGIGLAFLPLTWL